MTHGHESWLDYILRIMWKGLEVLCTECNAVGHDTEPQPFTHSAAYNRGRLYSFDRIKNQLNSMATLECISNIRNEKKRKQSHDINNETASPNTVITTPECPYRPTERPIYEMESHRLISANYRFLITNSVYCTSTQQKESTEKMGLIAEDTWCIEHIAHLFAHYWLMATEVPPPYDLYYRLKLGVSLIVSMKFQKARGFRARYVNSVLCQVISGFLLPNEFSYTCIRDQLLMVKEIEYAEIELLKHVSCFKIVTGNPITVAEELIWSQLSHNMLENTNDAFSARNIVVFFARAIIMAGHKQLLTHSCSATALAALAGAALGIGATVNCASTIELAREALCCALCATPVDIYTGELDVTSSSRVLRRGYLKYITIEACTSLLRNLDNEIIVDSNSKY